MIQKFFLCVVNVTGDKFGEFVIVVMFVCIWVYFSSIFEIFIDSYWKDAIKIVYWFWQSKWDGTLGERGGGFMVVLEGKGGGGSTNILFMYTIVSQWKFPLRCYATQYFFSTDPQISKFLIFA